MAAATGSVSFQHKAAISGRNDPELRQMQVPAQ